MKVLICLALTLVGAQDRPRSHPPLRTAPPPSRRTFPEGPRFFVDPRKGDDRADGSETAPWRTVAHGVGRLLAGDTLVLRGGTYYENVGVRLVGTKERPVTIRSFPGEQAVLDGGLREFFESPADCWKPAGKDEYVSSRPYPNRRHVIGSFGDSMVGLQSYYHAADLRAANELWEWENLEKKNETDIKPVYCGPGVWYDAETGLIHARLAPTTVPGADNYSGETDPRRLPLVLAPFRSVPLHVDGARHVRFQDLVIRGGGYDTVVIDQSSDVEFDNVTLWAGSFGMRVTGTHRLRLHRSGLYGNVAPWTFRTDTSLRSDPGRPHRDITRLNTHALLVPEAGREFSTYAFPMNEDWEISWCDFADGHDGIYLGGVSMKFHHNRVAHTHDDGIYLSQMYPRDRYLRGGARIEIYQNHIGDCLTAFAFGGPELVTKDMISIYRNVIDQRGRVPTARPGTKGQPAGFSTGQVMSDHGSPPWASMTLYHNTVIIAGRPRSPDMGFLAGAHADRPRRVFNNIFLSGGGLAPLQSPDPQVGQADGNLYWAPGADPKGYFDRYLASEAYARSKAVYAPGFNANSRAADPKLADDFRLQPGSAAIDTGADLPADWPDPLRAVDAGRPDIGALPVGVEPLRAGRGPK